MLITKETILKYREISKSVRDSKINPFIKDAEFADVRPLLGRALYRDLLSNSESETNTLLLSGGEYTYNDKTYEFDGLEIVICLFAYSRYILNGSHTDTAFGFVQKSNSDSTPVPHQTKQSNHDSDRDLAMQYWFEVESFLNRKKTDYPLWKGSSCEKKTNGRIRISKVTA